ncbi:MAG TPA: molybdopterin cofactor-binding domain-containing protein, partial [Agromyces sp.]
MSELAARPDGAVVGTRMPHESAAQHATGIAAYTDDLAATRAGVLTAWPVQSEQVHARVRLDVAPALDVPGVVHVLTADDVPGVNDAGTKHDEPLFPAEARYHGHALAWVLGESAEAARRGAAAVRVEYEPLPSIVTIAEAIEQGSYQGFAPTVQRGDAASALASAPHVFEGESFVGGQEHFYLETHASFARVDSEGQVFVDSSSQHPSETQEIVAHVLAVPSNRVTVQVLRLGGGFGGKEMQPHGLAAVAALGAVRTGRPVRLRLTRTQDLTMTGKRHPYHARWRAGFDDDGRILALEATLTADGGWSLDLSEPVLGRALCHVDNA